MSFELDYSQLVLLDAEDLAETGIRRAYVSLLPRLRDLVTEPADVEETIDDERATYVVSCGGQSYTIASPEIEHDSWALATYALFRIVNDQLGQSAYRFYAINGGNDLGGMFLTPAQAEAARATLTRKQDWPYLPTLDEPWYGQNHD